jgi:hypothetical protein
MTTQTIISKSDQQDVIRVLVDRVTFWHDRLDDDSAVIREAAERLFPIVVDELNSYLQREGR